jgi:hypothetical protein
MTMLVLALLAVVAGCRALDADADRDKARNAGGNGTMYREAGGARSR